MKNPRARLGGMGSGGWLSLAAGLSCGVASVAHAGAGSINVVALNVGFDDRTMVPGAPGLAFQSGISNQFGRPTLSANGQWMMLPARYDNAGSSIDNELVLVMSTSGSFSKMMAREGALAPFSTTLFYGNGTTSATIRRGMGINNDGAFAFASTIDAASNSDDVVTLWNGTAFSAYGREGTPSPILSVASWGSDNGSIAVLNDGRVCGRMANIAGVTARQLLYRGTEVLCETTQTVPQEQRFLPDQSIKTLSAERFRISANGESWITHATLNGPAGTSTVLILNNKVIAQSGSVLPGSGFVSTVKSFSTSEASQSISPDGAHWVFRGFNQDGQDWVTLDGVVIASRGQLVTPFGSELAHWSDTRFAETFFMNVTDNNSNYVIGGMMDVADTTRDAVLVWNGTNIVVQESDFVDLNGDGEDNDGLYIATFNNDAAALTNDGFLFFTADLKDGSGVVVGQGLLSKRVFVPCPCSADFDQSGGTPDATDINAYFDAWLLGDPAADADCSGGTPDGTDIDVFFHQWLAGGC